jgi:predicted Zn-dependent peptidase
MASSPENIRKEVLPNGLVVLTEPMAHVRSVSVGLWLRTGSRREPAELNGISHFIEHMVFKGTERRTVEEIARAIDRVGGMLDAFTSKEMVCFNAKVLDEHLPIAFAVLADLLLRPLFAEEEIVREKQVVLEEIKMDEDNPETLINELFTQSFWRGHALGKPILGTPKTVPGFSRETLVEWFRRSHSPNNMVIAAAGNLEHERLMDLVRTEFEAVPAAADGFADSAPVAHPTLTTRHKHELEQVHICVGVPAFPMADPRRYAAILLNNILGTGMSSRLFQNIRERQGLAYAVFSEMNPYRDVGLLSVYAGTARETAGRLVRSVVEEFRDLKGHAVSDEELRRAKDQLKGSLTLSVESSGARMTSLARHEIYFGRHILLDEILASIEAVTAEQVQQVAQDFFRPDRIAATVLGNLDGFELTRDHLAC